MKTFIFTDITADIPKNKKYEDFEILPFSLSVDDDHYDNITTSISNKDFYNRMRKGAKASTSMINQVLLKDSIEEKLKAGYDVLYLCFSSALSGTYNVAMMVQRELKELYPNNKIAVVNSLNASIGEGLFVHYVVKKRDEGAEFNELVEYAEDIKNHVCSYFTVDDLKHLARMGRVSKTAAFVGELVQIKPVLYVNALGELVPITKVKSRKKSIKALADKMEEKMLDVKEQDLIYIGHGDCEDDAKFLANEIQSRFDNKLNIEIDYIGPVIGAHTNAGVVAVFFLGTDKKEAKDARVCNK